MHERDLEIDGRLAALAARAPGGEDPPTLPRRNRRGRVALSLTLAPILILVMVASVAGAAVVGIFAQGRPGIENPGQPLAGAGLECMSPPQAAAYLAAHGFPNVAWQLEAGSGGKEGGTTVVTSTPPDHGYVIPGSVLEDGLLRMVIDQRHGATGVGACVDMPMP